MTVVPKGRQGRAGVKRRARGNSARPVRHAQFTGGGWSRCAGTLPPVWQPGRSRFGAVWWGWGRFGGSRWGRGGRGLIRRLSGQPPGRPPGLPRPGLHRWGFHRWGFRGRGFGSGGGGPRRFGRGGARTAPGGPHLGDAELDHPFNEVPRQRLIQGKLHRSLARDIPRELGLERLDRRRRGVQTDVPGEPGEMHQIDSQTISRHTIGHGFDCVRSRSADDSPNSTQLSANAGGKPCEVLLDMSGGWQGRTHNRDPHNSTPPRPAA